MTAPAIRHVAITGRVQGVGYRAWTADEARACGLQGWVRNRRDGSVEAVFAGPVDAVEEIIGRCRRGPPLARVSDVTVRDATSDELALSGKDVFVSLSSL